MLSVPSTLLYKLITPWIAIFKLLLCNSISRVQYLCFNIYIKYLDVSDCGDVAFAADAVHIYFERGVSGVNRIESGEGGLPPFF